MVEICRKERPVFCTHDLLFLLCNKFGIRYVKRRKGLQWIINLKLFRYFLDVEDWI